MPDAVSLPWHHPTLDALAAVLGVTVRTLELWRERGAPIPAAGPFDELAIRLWHAAQLLLDKAGRKLGALAEPVGLVADYCVVVDGITAAAKAVPKPKEDPRISRMARKLDLQNARAEDSLGQEAKARFVAWVGRTQTLLVTSLTGLALDELMIIAAKPRPVAQPAACNWLRAQVAAAVAAALRMPDQKGRR